MKPFLQTIDFAVTGEKFELMLDENLQMLVTQPKPENLDSYYESDDYISHTDASNSTTDKIYHYVKRLNLKMKTRLVEKYGQSNKTLLELGAGTGDFLVACRKEGWSVEGVEPNRDARLRSSEKGMELLKEIDSLPSVKFQVITLWHVLEHLPNLEQQIVTLKRHLEDEGTMIVAVPNYKSHDAKYYGKFWAAYDVPRHLWHFSRRAIEKLFFRFEMEVVETKPLFFDAFYVSLLSEKYKSGRKNFLKAFGVGLISNLRAVLTKEHSSIIYVLKKKDKLSL